jgi:uncharacterized LabA/DUF88 family protein
LNRVISYIDGFNLYFGLRTKGWRKFYWLNVGALSASLLKPSQRLMCVNYFTARIRASPGSEESAQRQSMYLDVLRTVPDLNLHEGHFLKKQRTCRSCGNEWTDYEEKMTDVNLATALLTDAFDDRFDTALVVSGDSDLAAPVRVVRERFPRKKVVVAFPPGRRSDQLRRLADAAFTIGEQKLRDSLLPLVIALPSGYIARRPTRWC